MFLSHSIRCRHTHESGVLWCRCLDPPAMAILAADRQRSCLKSKQGQFWRLDRCLQSKRQVTFTHCLVNLGQWLRILWLSVLFILFFYESWLSTWICWILSCHGYHLLTENENISLVHEFEGFLCVCFVEFLFLTFLHWGKNDSLCGAPSFRERFMSLKTLQWLKLINKVLACCWSCSISCLRNALENSFHIIFSLQYHKSPQSHLQSQHAQSLQRAGKDTGAFSANKQDLFPQELLAVLSTRLFYRMHCSVLFPPNYPKYFDSVAFLSFMLFLLPCLVSDWAVMVLIMMLQILRFA